MTLNEIIRRIIEQGERSERLRRKIEVIWQNGGSCYGLCDDGYIEGVYCPFYMTEKCPIYQARMRRLADEALIREIGVNFARKFWPDIERNLDGFKKVKVSMLYREMKRVKQGIYVHGEVGSGKTYLLSRIFWLIAYKGEPVIYRTREIDKAAYYVKWLLLDELFTYKSQRYYEAIWDVLDYRYRSGLLRTTVIASNLTPQEVGIQDARLADRLFSRGQMRVLQIRRENAG